MAQEVAQEVSLTLKVKVYQNPENNLEYRADITVNDHTVSTGGLLDRKHVIGYIDMTLQNAQAYLGFVERSKTEESRKYNLDLLQLHLELALAHALAYEIAKDNLVEEDPCRLWKAIGEKWCAYTECVDFVKEDFEACMETCRKEWCGSQG
jgi:hypothetical protein